MEPTGAHQSQWLREHIIAYQRYQNLPEPTTAYKSLQEPSARRAYNSVPEKTGAQKLPQSTRAYQSLQKADTAYQSPVKVEPFHSPNRAYKSLPDGRSIIEPSTAATRVYRSLLAS